MLTHLGRSVGVGGATAAAAWVAQQALQGFGVFFTPLFTAVVTILAATLALLADRGRVVAESAQQDRRLDELLACYPPPAVCDADPYDVAAIAGAGPGDGPTAYTRRNPLDHRLATVVSRNDVVVVTGPARAGKSRAALHALRRTHPDRLLLVPEDGPALRSLLGGSLPAAWTDSGVVLWLDDLERFVGELEVDALDALRLAGGRIVATVDRDDLDELREARTQAGRATRRLLGRAAVVRVDGDDLLRRVPDAGVAEWSDPLCAPPAPRPAPRRVRDDVAAMAAGAFAVALLGAIGYLAMTNEVLKPDPLAEQLAERRREAATCSPVDVQPSSTDGAGEGSTFFMIVRASQGCTRSDRIDVLRVRHGRLDTVSRIRPARTPGGYFELVCRGESRRDPCLLPGAAGAVDPVLVGGWRDTASGRMMPFTLHRVGKRYQLAGLSAASRAPNPRPSAWRPDGRYGEPVRLRDAGTQRVITSAPAVEDFVVREGADGPEVALGYAWRGAFEAPDRILIVPTALKLKPDPRLTACTAILRPRAGGGYIRQMADGEVSLPRLLHRRWAAAVSAGKAVC